MKVTLIAVCSSLLAAASAAAQPGPGGLPGPGYDGLNLARNVRVADGHLIVVAKHEIVDGKPAHTGGGVISKHRFGYGYYECRSQPFMAGRGVHTAFWQRGMGGPENNSIFEIDSTQKIACNNLYVDVSTKGYMELCAGAYETGRARSFNVAIPLRRP
jgi:hypothetical protein